MALAALLASWLSVAAAPVAGNPRVTVYPSGSSVPENLLRIEVRSAQPLRPPLEVRHISLRDAQGQAIEEAFLDLMLPSADGRRVTILMHPGRVKAGVGLNVMHGRALHVGKRVSFVIDHPALAHPLRKTWTVTASDSQPLQPEQWRFQAPRLHSRDTLSIHMEQPISSSAEALIAIRDAQGERVAGRISLAHGETVWRFTPSHPWRAGAYAIVTHPDLEDPAGNRACAAFERVRASAVRCDAETAIPFEAHAR